MVEYPGADQQLVGLVTVDEALQPRANHVPVADHAGGQCGRDVGGLHRAEHDVGRTLEGLEA